MRKLVFIILGAIAILLLQPMMEPAWAQDQITRCVKVKIGKEIYQPGETVKIIFTNSCIEPISLPQPMQWGVTGNGGRVNISFPTRIPTPLLPGQQHRWSWDQKDNQGQPVPGGIYSVYVIYQEMITTGLEEGSFIIKRGLSCAGVQTDQGVYTLAEPVNITFGNNCAEPITMANAPWFILDSDGHEIYGPVSSTEISVPSREEHSWIWNQTDQNLRQISEGRYTAWLVTWDAGVHTTTFEIKVGEPISLKRFDMNNNNQLDDFEFFAAIDQWVTGQISDQLFFPVLDAWVAQTPVKEAGASLRSVALLIRSIKGSVTFAVRGSVIVSMALEIFDPNGQRIFVQQAAGTRLTWSLRKMSGEPVANGVYLYRLTVRGINGEVLRNEVKRLVVLR